MKNTIKVIFDTSEYARSNDRYIGAQPRGRGAWAFSSNGCHGTRRLDEIWFAPTGTYVEAKRAAAEHFREKLVEHSTAPLCGGAVLTLYVLP
jgi:hypothetical protein